MTPTGAIMAKLIRDTAANVLEIWLGILLAWIVVRQADANAYAAGDLWAVLVIGLVGILVIAFLRWLPIGSR